MLDIARYSIYNLVINERITVNKYTTGNNKRSQVKAVSASQIGWGLFLGLLIIVSLSQLQKLFM